MSKNALYKSIIASKINETIDRIKKEQTQKKEEETLTTIKELMTSRKKRPSLEDARVYIEILEQEYPLFMTMNDYDIIKLAREELEVELLPRQVSIIRRHPCVNVFYELTYFG